MGYIGTPIDTRNTFQSLVGKRFNGDGSTTAFTLDVAPSSTLDIEVFVGNVRQDPNSAYTLSGTTLTFTGAPPSGTNNIYVVHQAKAVGTIDLPEGALVDLNGGSDKLVLDADGDTTISADTDDQIDIKIAGADDFKFTANNFNVLSGSTLTIDSGATITNSGTANGFGTNPDGAQVFNESGADVDFRVETNNEPNTFFINGGDDNIIIGANSTDDYSISGSTFNTLLAIEGSGSNNPTLRIDSNSTSKSAELHLVNPSSSGSGSGANIAFIEGTTRQMYIQYSFNSGFLNFSTTGGEVFRINEGGTVASGDFNDTSDRGLKENIADIADGTSIIKQLKPRTFKWKGEKVDRGNSAGFIAQEVKEVLPNLIDGEEYDESKPLEERTKLSVRTHGIVSYLTKALQESITKIEALEARVTTLEG
jgi:hypothetical protein